MRKLCLLSVLILSIASMAYAQDDYYLKKAKSYQREAEYYQKKAESYHREAAYHLKRAESYQREVAYYTKRGDIDKAKNYSRYAETNWINMIPN